MSTDLNIACRQFVGVLDGELVCHTGVLPLPMSRTAKRLHRSVVLPDFQGIGIGMNFKNAVCDILRRQGWGGQIWSTTTTPAQFHAQIKSPKWKLIRYGRCARNRPASMSEDMARGLDKSSAVRRITYSFLYIGDEGKETL